MYIKLHKLSLSVFFCCLCCFSCSLINRTTTNYNFVNTLSVTATAELFKVSPAETRKHFYSSHFFATIDLFLFLLIHCAERELHL